MATIDPGPFGNYTAPAVRPGRSARPVPEAFDTTGGIQELARGAAIASDIGANVAAQQRREQEIAAERARREAEQAARVEEATRARRDQIQLGEEVARTAQSILDDDSIPGDQKEARLDEFVTQRRAALEPTYKIPDLLGAQQANIDEISVRARAGIREGLTRQNRAKVSANVAQSIESLGRQALSAGDADPYIDQAFKIIDESAAAAGWDALDVEKQKQAVSESWTETVVAQRVNDDPAGALEALDGDAYPRLDPKVRIALRGQAEAELERRANRARIEADAREARAGRAMGQLSNIFEQGLQPDAQMVATATALAQGTIYEQELEAMQAAARDRARFAVAPIEQQQQELEALRSRYTDPSQGATPAEAWGYRWREQQLANTQQDIRARGGLMAAAARRVIDLPPLDVDTPEALAEGLSARREAAAQASAWAGQPVGLLTPSELRAFSENLKRTPADQQAATIHGFALAVGDPQEFRQIMAELAPSNGAAASAGRLLVDKAPGARDAAELILKGEAYLNPPGEGAKPLVRLPNADAIARKFDDLTGEAYVGSARVRGMDLDNARRVYAALSAQEGDFTQDPQDVDGKRMQRAIEIATGGIGEYAGAAVVLPRGMSEDELTSRVQDRLLELNRNNGLITRFNDSQLLDLQIENAPRGYYVKQGGAYLLDRKGYKVNIDPRSAPIDWQAPLAAADPEFDVPPAPAPDWQPNPNDLRPDGTQKGRGYFGPLRTPDGGTMTELSVGFNIDGREVDVPALVPTLTRGEVRAVLNAKQGQRLPQSVYVKAEAFARDRLARGLSPFARPEEEGQYQPAPNPRKRLQWGPYGFRFEDVAP